MFFYLENTELEKKNGGARVLRGRGRGHEQRAGRAGQPGWPRAARCHAGHHHSQPQARKHTGTSFLHSVGYRKILTFLPILSSHGTCFFL